MRSFVALFLALVTGLFSFTGGTALMGSWFGAALLATAVAGVVGLLAYARPPIELDEAACSRGLKIVSGVAAALALVGLARLAVFMVDPSQVGYSFLPTSRFEVQHSCVSAYFVSAKAASSTSDIYADSLFTAPDDDPNKIRKPLTIGPFRIDVFEYPPPFLLLPRALSAVTPEFLNFRMLWFALSGSIVLIGLLVVARFLGPTTGTRALLLSPLVWIAAPTISDLQKGNIQIVVIAWCMLAMVLFERRQRAAGGALLAFACVGKLYPSLLVLYLIARREWRAVAWTAVFGLAFIVLTIADIGWAPYLAFRERLPGLLGGEAFPAFRNPAATAINFSIPGIVFKLKLFGVPGMTFGASKIVGWVYTLVAGAATVLAGRRAWRDGEKPMVWMAILILATLRSPFLPEAYAAFPPVWLLTLLAASMVPTPRAIWMFLVLWVGLNIYWPIDQGVDPRLLAIASGVPQALTVAVAFYALRRGPRPELAPAGAQA